MEVGWYLDPPLLSKESCSMNMHGLTLGGAEVNLLCYFLVPPQMLMATLQQPTSKSSSLRCLGRPLLGQGGEDCILCRKSCWITPVPRTKERGLPRKTLSQGSQGMSMARPISTHPDMRKSVNVTETHGESAGLPPGSTQPHGEIPSINFSGQSTEKVVDKALSAPSHLVSSYFLLQ